MKKLPYLSLALFFSILMLSVSSLADNRVTLGATPQTLTIAAGNSGSIVLTVNNNQNSADIFTISIIAPPNFQGSVAVSQNNVLIPPLSSSNVNVSFAIPSCVSSSLLQFTISATSVSNTAIGSLQNVNLQMSGFNTCIDSVSSDKIELNPGDSVTFSANIRNLVPYSVADNSLSFIISKDGKTIFQNTTSLFLPSTSSRAYSFTYQFDKYAAPGVYNANAILKAGDGTVVDSKYSSLKLDAKNNLVKSETQTSYLLISQTTVVFKNDGNVPSDSTTYSKQLSVLTSLFFNPSTPVSQKSSSGWNVVYSWQVPSMTPSQTFTINYGISYINVWTITMVAVIILVLIYLNFYSVSILKAYSFGGRGPLAKEISVSLEIKNRGYKEVKDLVVKDKVPNVSRLDERFETLKPITKKLIDGMELTWRIPSMKPHEVRIITYRIKPVVEILGTLNLPEAKVVFEGTKNRRVTKYSNSLAIR